MVIQKGKQNFKNNIDITNFTDNAKFLKNINPLFSEKGQANGKINLVKDNTIITDDKKGADTLNDLFQTAVKKPCDKTRY